MMAATSFNNRVRGVPTSISDVGATPWTLKGTTVLIK